MGASLSEEQTSAIQLNAVTAFAMAGDEAKILASGCDFYMSKPFNVQAFIEMVALLTSRG